MSRGRRLWPWVAGLFALSSSAVLADDPPPRRDGFFGGLRDVFDPESGNEAWERARAMPRAAEAVPIMEQLARSEKDLATAAKASLWLGLYRYGAGEVSAAQPYFERVASLDADGSTRSAAAAWAAQCRGLLDPKSMTKPNVAGTRSGPLELREVLAHADAGVREGRAQEALDAYLALQAEATEAGMLSLLYYRLGLVVAASAAAGTRLVDPGLLQEWEPKVAESAERALVVKLEEEGRLIEKPAAPAVLEFVAPAEELVGTEDPMLDTLSTARGGKSGAEPVYVVQLGSFRDEALARAELERLLARGLSVRIEPGSDADGKRLYRIWLGRGSTREEAKALGERLLQGMEYQLVEIPR